MKLLITGGCGFMGTNLALHALKNKYHLSILDNLSREGSKSNLDFLKSIGNFSFTQKDITSTEDVEKTLKELKPDVVIHLAGQVAMTTSVKNPMADFRINALGTLNVLEAMKEHCPNSTIIYSSTNKVYGDLENHHYIESDLRYDFADFKNGLDENTPLSFSTPYGCSKGAADQYVLDYGKMHGLKSVVFRHSSAFGLRQFSTFDQGWIGWFIKQALETKSNPSREVFTISGNGKQVRDVLFSDDLVNCYFSAISNINRASGQAFNIGGGYENSISLLELFEFLNKTLKIKLQYQQLAWRHSDQKVFIADISKAKNLLQWAPKTNAFEGIQAMMAWSEANA